MPPELSDLLRDAAADGPPARYGVDDAVRAGRRRRQRRQTGWAVAAVAAVAVTVAVPQFVTRGAAPAPVAPTLSPSPSPSPTGTTIRGPELAFTFRGFSAGDLTVADPEVWTLAGETAMIRRKGAPAGVLSAFRPGVQRVDRGKDRITATAPVRGRRAFLIEPPAAAKAEGVLPTLAWEYADDGSLAMVNGLRRALSLAEMRRVAEGFTLGDERPVTMGFRIGHVPDGWKLVRTSTRSSDLIPARDAAARLARPDRESPPDRDVPRLMIGVLPDDNADEADKANDRPGPVGRPWCERNQCRLYDGHNGVVMTVSFDGVSEAEATRVLASVQVGPVDAMEGVPASARVGGR